MYAVQADCVKKLAREEFVSMKEGRTLQLFGGLYFALGDVEGLAVVDVKLQFSHDVSHNFVRLCCQQVDSIRDNKHTLEMSSMVFDLYAARELARAKCTLTVRNDHYSKSQLTR